MTKRINHVAEYRAADQQEKDAGKRKAKIAHDAISSGAFTAKEFAEKVGQACKTIDLQVSSWQYVIDHGNDESKYGEGYQLSKLTLPKQVAVQIVADAENKTVTQVAVAAQTKGGADRAKVDAMAAQVVKQHGPDLDTKIAKHTNTPIEQVKARRKAVEKAKANMDSPNSYVGFIGIVAHIGKAVSEINEARSKVTNVDEQLDRLAAESITEALAKLEDSVAMFRALLVTDLDDELVKLLEGGS